MHAISSARVHIPSRVDDEAVWNSNIRVCKNTPVLECVCDGVDVKCVSGRCHPNKWMSYWEGINQCTHIVEGLVEPAVEPVSDLKSAKMS